jgi:CBS-domain-containing membrane protein
MRRRFNPIDPKLRHKFGRYISQVALAALALFVVFSVKDLVTGGAVTSGILVAAIGSTAFVLFIMPHSDTARPRHALGGHLAALTIGAAVGWLFDTTAGQQLLGDVNVLFAIKAALAVGLSMFAMAATNSEHPPAAGTALAVVTRGFSAELVFFFVTSVVGLVVIHRLLRSRLRNLY